MAFKIPDWMLKTGKYLQSGDRPYTSDPYSQDMSVFSKYEKGSPLQNVFNQGEAQFGRLQTPANPTIEGAPVAEIPKLEAMPIGQGSWFNRKEPPASLQTWIKKQAEEEVKQAREQKALLVLIASNPIEFAGRPPESFGSLKDAEAYLKSKRDLDIKRGGKEETKRHNQAAEAAAAAKNNPEVWAPPKSSTAPKFSKTMKSGKVMISDDGSNWRPK